MPTSADSTATLPSGIGFIDHIERHLGLIQDGWTKTFEGEDAPFQVIQCAGGMIEEVDAFLTLGLGGYPLCSWFSDKSIRHELLLTLRSGQKYDGIADLLQQIGSEAMRRGHAYLRGEVLGPRNALFEGSLLEAFYVAIPVYYPDEFAVYESPDGDGEDIVIAWLVPITRAEAEYVHENGWSAFENLLVEHDPDLFDIMRPSIV